VISLQAPDVRDKGVAIDCELNPALPVAFADAAQIQQVLFNLLVDAYEAMSRSKQPKKLRLRTDFTDDHVGLEVEINGGCVTTLEHLLEAVVADESRGTVLGPRNQSFHHRDARGTLEAIRREGEVTCVFASSYLASAHRRRSLMISLNFIVTRAR
jgi:hypothetical protein